MGTKANIDLFDRQFCIHSDGHPSLVIPALLDDWQAYEYDKNLMLLNYYEDQGWISQGWLSNADYQYTVEYGETATEIVITHEGRK